MYEFFLNEEPDRELEMLRGLPMSFSSSRVDVPGSCARAAARVQHLEDRQAYELLHGKIVLRLGPFGHEAPPVLLAFS